MKNNNDIVNNKSLEEEIKQAIIDAECLDYSYNGDFEEETSYTDEDMATENIIKILKKYFI